MANLLTKAQAEAVYSAMVALNNVNARVHCRIETEEGSTLHAVEYEDQAVYIYFGNAIGHPDGNGIENYRNQADFANAYGVA